MQYINTARGRLFLIALHHKGASWWPYDPAHVPAKVYQVGNFLFITAWLCVDIYVRTTCRPDCVYTAPQLISTLLSTGSYVSIEIYVMHTFYDGKYGKY